MGLTAVLPGGMLQRTDRLAFSPAACVQLHRRDSAWDTGDSSLHTCCSAFTRCHHSHGAWARAWVPVTGCRDTWG